MGTQGKHQAYIELLKSNYNLILTGAPGTGKTYLAKEIAKEMLGLDSVEQLVTDKHCCIVQFHPSYDYTDFVEGLRPKSDESNNLFFERKDGVFKEFCKRAVISQSTDKEVHTYAFCNSSTFLSGVICDQVRVRVLNRGRI